jgi:undecaprenyl-diphosphatase
MSNLEGILYGIIQGLSEFLPISSSGHLALLPHFLNIEDPGILFDLSMHVGTALSILIYFRKKIMTLLIQLLGFLKGNREHYEAINMVVSTLASFVIILLIKNVAAEYGRTPFMIALNLLIFGLIMWIFDVVMPSESETKMNKWQPTKARLIGIAQALAVFPGVSRSGITLTAARALNLSRREGTEYSFLLALPIIVAGFLYKVPEFFNGSANFDFSVCLLGMLVSFATGIVTIHYFLKFIAKMGLVLFFFYRAFIALLIYWLL